MRSRSSRFRLGLALLGAMLAVSVAGCSDDDPPPDPPTTTSTTTAPSTTLSPEEEDEQALRQLAEDWYVTTQQIFNEGMDPSIAESLLTSEYLSRVKAEVARRDRNDLVSHADPQNRSMHTVESVEVEGDTAVLGECIIDGDLLLKRSTGEIVNEAVAAFRYETRATRMNGRWVLSGRETLEEREGQTECTA